MVDCEFSDIMTKLGENIEGTDREKFWDVK